MLWTFLEVFLWKLFQLFRRFLDYIRGITKAPSLQCWCQSREHIKINWSRVRRVQGILQCCHFILYYKLLYQNRPVCWRIAVKEKPTLGSQLFGTFPFDRIPNAKKNVKVLFFIHSNNSGKLYQWIYFNYSSEFLEFFKLLLMLKSTARKKIH
jgi:hypothetical protein